MDNSTLTKMQLHYWEAKQTFLKKVKRKEDDCVVASDAELDAKLELLKSIDETNQNLLGLLDLYQDRVCACAQEECLIGRFMRECGKVDPTKAGKLMAGSGKTLLFASHQFILLRNILIRVYRDVQTFQYRAVADTFDTVEQMEKARTAYRAALLWMKDLSKQLNPEAYNQMDKFKKVQEHVRKTRRAFEKLKLDSVQKIDLLSASRCNLFSNVLANYQNNLASIWGKSAKVMNIFVETFDSSAVQQTGYEFTVLKELNNETADERFESFEARLKEILAQDNLNEKDMLVFFETDYKDEKGDKAAKKGKGGKTGGDSKSKNSNKSKSDLKNEKKEKTTNKESSETPGTSLVDLSFDSETTQTGETGNVDLLGDISTPSAFMPSSLIDLDHLHKMDSDQLIKTDFDQLLQWPNEGATDKVETSTAATSSSKQNTSKPSSSSTSDNTLQSWLNLFADIDPLANPGEFDKFSSDKNTFDRNC